MEVGECGTDPSGLEEYDLVRIGDNGCVERDSENEYR